MATSCIQSELQSPRQSLQSRSQIALFHLQATLPSSSAKDCITNLISLMKEDKFKDSFHNFDTEVTGCLEDLINTVNQKYKVTTTIREKLWVEFHKLRIDKKSVIMISWEKLINSLEVSAESYNGIPQQSLYEEIFRVIVKEHFAKEKTPSGSEQVVKDLTFHEMNSMRYVCGYVVRTLLRRYESKSSDVYSQYEQCLGQMAVTADDVDELEDTTKWFHQVNRGGLMPINDITFTFFVEVEKKVRCLLPSHVVKQSDETTLKKDIIEKVIEDDDLQFYWALTSQDIDSPEDGQQLLFDIVSLWVTIRGFSLASTWMEEYKAAHKKTTQKSASLRKTLQS